MFFIFIKSHQYFKFLFTFFIQIDFFHLISKLIFILFIIYYFKFKNFHHISTHFHFITIVFDFKNFLYFTVKIDFMRFFRNFL